MQKKTFHPFCPSKTGLVLAIFSTMLLAAACTADQLPESTLSCTNDIVTYDNQIKPIIDTYCGISGCHNSASALDDYTNYAGMQGILNVSGFQNRVIDTPAGESTKMPPPYTVGPKIIPDADLELIQCWINAGYPQN